MSIDSQGAGGLSQQERKDRAGFQTEERTVSGGSRRPPIRPGQRRGGLKNLAWSALAVVGLVGLVVGLSFLFHRLPTWNHDRQRAGYRAACEGDARSVEFAVDAYHSNSADGGWPSDIATLTRSDANGGPYLRSLPTSKHYTI